MTLSPSTAGTDSELAFGAAIGDSGTRFALTVGSTQHARRWHARLPAPATPELAAETIAALVARAAAEEGPSALGTSARVALGVALEDAKVDGRGGSVTRLRRAPGWEDTPFARVLTQRLRVDGHTVRVALASAADAAAVAESRIGAGHDMKGSEPLLYLRLARDVTCSVVIGGRYLEGMHGAQGQMGHFMVREGGPRCSCGAYGHLEPLASAQSLVRNLIGRASASDESTAAMLRVSGGRAEAMTAADVVRLAAEGDPAASGVLDDALDALVPVLGVLIATLAPSRLVLGGPLALAGEAFLQPLRDRLAAHYTVALSIPDLRSGTLEPAAPLLGARLLAETDGILH